MSANKGKLKVRKHIWRPLNGSEGPRTEVFNLEKKRWQPSKSIGEARKYARRKGYSGIVVEMLA